MLHLTACNPNLYSINMSSFLSRSLALVASFAAAPAMALGLGDIVLQSRLGEPLRAEIPIIAGDETAAAAHCFSLVNGSDPALPSITNSKLRLIQRGGSLRLQVMGGNALFEPIFVIAVRINCGVDMQREYVLMPEAPPENPNPPFLAERISAPSEAGREKAGAAHDDQSAAPRSTKNPAPLRTRNATPPSAPPPAQPRRQAIAPGEDHLVLGAAESLGASSTSLAMAELDDQLLRMETTLHGLHQEIEKMDDVLTLTRQTAEVAPATSQPATPPTAATEPQAMRWLELLASALLGGVGVFAVAVLLGRWQERRRRA